MLNLGNEDLACIQIRLNFQVKLVTIIVKKNITEKVNNHIKNVIHDI